MLGRVPVSLPVALQKFLSPRRLTRERFKLPLPEAGCSEGSRDTAVTPRRVNHHPGLLRTEKLSRMWDS